MKRSRVNAVFSRRTVVSGDDYRWIASPQSGVERVMLDRVGDEQARATSIVRYAPGSHFPHHRHPGGEEILVLSGTFSADGEDFPVGVYLRNPPGSCHVPSSAEGADIFVKLWQMRADEIDAVRVDTRDRSRWHLDAGRDRCALFRNDLEEVSLLRVPPNGIMLPDPVDGAELLVLAGHLRAEGLVLGQGSWLRVPAGDARDIVAGTHGATVYLKIGPVGVMHDPAEDAS